MPLQRYIMTTMLYGSLCRANANGAERISLSSGRYVSMALSRRDFGKVISAVIPAVALAKFSPNQAGVRLGVCTYSFRDLPRANGGAIGPVIGALKDCNSSICELFSPQLEPENALLTKLMHQIATPGPDGKAPTMDQIREKACLYDEQSPSQGPAGQAARMAAQNPHGTLPGPHGSNSLAPALRSSLTP